MNRNIRSALLTLAFAAAAFAQTPAAFDAASIRPSAPAPQTREVMKRIFGRETIQTSPDGITMRNASLKNMTRWAYHVTEYQVIGPNWIDNERYDITAKSGKKVSEAELRQMMQTLLADRFKMISHQETKEMKAFVLQVANTGTKLKESGSEGDADLKPDAKTMSVTASRAPVALLVDGLSNIFRAPVVDQTGLTGKYDVVINAGKYVSEVRGDNGTPADPQAVVIRGLQEELGLKLEAKKVSVDVVVIDRAEKVPIAN
jgi:uncharacterized protein (TIGR03435 family)